MIRGNMEAFSTFIHPFLIQKFAILVQNENKYMSMRGVLLSLGPQKVLEAYGWEKTKYKLKISKNVIK